MSLWSWPLKTATCFSLALFPQMFLLHRVKRADVIIVLTDKNIDETNHVNRCVIRTAMESYRSLTMPVLSIGLPVDRAVVPDRRTWGAQFARDIRRAYRGLVNTEEMEALVAETLSRVNSPWLTDYLMEMFVVVLERLGFGDKKVVRGSSGHRRRYPNESEYILDMCIEHDCDKVIVGRGQQLAMQQRLFRRNDLSILTQKWEGSKELPPRDSVLDVMARLPIEEIVSQLQ